jgi:hypothetical protein
MEERIYSTHTILSLVEVSTHTVVPRRWKSGRRLSSHTMFGSCKMFRFCKSVNRAYILLVTFTSSRFFFFACFVSPYTDFTKVQHTPTPTHKHISRI